MLWDSTTAPRLNNYAPSLRGQSSVNRKWHTAAGSPASSTPGVSPCVTFLLIMPFQTRKIQLIKQAQCFTLLFSSVLSNDVYYMNIYFLCFHMPCGDEDCIVIKKCIIQVWQSLGRLIFFIHHWWKEDVDWSYWGENHVTVDNKPFLLFPRYIIITGEKKVHIIFNPPVMRVDIIVWVRQKALMPKKGHYNWNWIAGAL